MFLLIFVATSISAIVFDFNTSHVSINPKANFSIAKAISISIHLMFLLIIEPDADRNRGSVISIHLMFLLIETDGPDEGNELDFNTSHVSINHQP